FVLIQVVHQASDDGLHITTGMETQYVLRLFDADLVVPELIHVLDAEIRANGKPLLNRVFHQVCNLSHRIVSRSDVKDTRNCAVRFHGPDVSGGGVVNAQNWSPDRWVVDSNHAALHRRLKHGINDEVKPHSWAIS